MFRILNLRKKRIFLAVHPSTLAEQCLNGIVTGGGGVSYGAT